MDRIAEIFLASGSAYGLGGAVASEEPLASYLGAKVLDAGGNAVDAAIVTSLSLAVLVPHLGGLGGDLFSIIRTPEGKVFVLNGSGRSPRSFGMEALASRDLHALPERSPLTITVPGMVGALHELWRRFGTMEWKELVRPVISLSRGFPAPPSLSRAVRKHYEILSKDEGSSITYKPIESWQILSFPGLSAALELISEDPMTMYRGEIAERLAEYVARRGGLLGLEDLKTYEPSWEEPIESSYRGWGVYEIPPNSQGVTTLHILKLLEELPRPSEPIGSLRLISSLAPPCYLWRDENIGDPNYMRLSKRDLLSHEVLESIKSMSRSSGAQRGSAAGDTTFFAVADRAGTAVAVIQSLFYPFGSGITEPRFQITLNNRATGFSAKAHVPNSIGPLKRPLHTLSALLLVSPKEERIILIGASGGHHRPQQHAIFASYIVDHDRSIEEAISLPRMVWDYTSGRIIAEREIAEGTAVEAIGVANAVELRGSVKGAATDRRGDGVPIALP